MKKLLFLLLCTGFLQAGPVFGWGREGHETIAKIAERNLTKRAKKRIEKYLGGHSVVYYAKWMDEYRKTPEYAFTDGWHTTTAVSPTRPWLSTSNTSFTWWATCTARRTSNTRPTT